MINQFNYNMKERDDLLSKKEEALIILESLEHTMVATTGQYVDVINRFAIVKKKKKNKNRKKKNGKNNESRSKGISIKKKKNNLSS